MVSRRMEDQTLTQRHKTHSISQRMEDLHDTQDGKAKQNYLSKKTQILEV
jgi:hypothetical protein